MSELTAEQQQWVERGLDKRCRLLFVSGEVQFAPEGAHLGMKGYQDRFVPLPHGYRVEREMVAGPDDNVPEGVRVFVIQHDSFRWVEEARTYPVIQTPEARSAA